MIADPYYRAARRVLLDALEALADHQDAVIVAGAQAVYLRTGHAQLGVAEYTTDGDLALDPSKLTDTPVLGDAMRVRFEPLLDAQGHAKPGVWVQMIEIEGREVDVPVDLIVPEGVAPPGGSRGARLGVHGKRAARKVPGLEAATIDSAFLTIGALDHNDDRRIRARVAGPTALLIAKAFKIQDRLDETRRPDRLVDKDAADVYRLMQTTRPDDVRKVAFHLATHERVGEASRRGMTLLRAQFGARRSDGVEMAVRSLRVGVPEARIRSVCTEFVAALDALGPGRA